MKKISKTYRLDEEALKTISYLADVTGHNSTQIIEIALDTLLALRSTMRCYNQSGNDPFYADLFVKDALTLRPELINEFKISKFDA